MCKFAIGQCQKQRHDRAQMHRQQTRHGGGIFRQHQGQARHTDKEQQGNETPVHGSLLSIAMVGVSRQIQTPQPQGAQRQRNTANGTQQFGQAGEVVGCWPI